MTGMSSSWISRASISKQSGARMSSRWMPPKPPAMRLTVSTKESGSSASMQDRHRRDAGELAVEHRLALHDGHRGDGADVAEAEDARAVGADGDGPADHREAVGERRVVRDRKADAGDAGRVDVAHVLEGAHLVAADDFELAALVRVEGAVPEGDDTDAVDLAEPVGDALCLLVVAHLDGDLADRAIAADRDRVDVADEAVLPRRCGRIPSRAARRRGAARSGRRSRRPWSRRLDPGAGWRGAALQFHLGSRGLFPLFPLNTPNILTVSRILMVPVIVVALLDETAEGDVIAAALFAVAALTDGLDGYIARRQRQETTFGKLMDPLADKLLVTAALVSLVSLDRRPPGWRW